MKLKKQLLCFASLLISFSLTAQSTDQVSMGAAYANQAFYKIADGTVTTASHADWHIAFSTLGSTDAGIFINETAALGSNPVKLYGTTITDFSTTIDTATATLTELGNAEESWSYGAFNENRQATDPFDYGWGSYSMITHTITGSKVYVLDIPSIGMKKMVVDSLIAGTYYFRYADLDGSNTQSKSVAKSSFTSSQLAYFSFSTNSTIANPEPADWDLVFTGYQTSIPDGSGGVVPYGVRGILTADGVEVAQADGINPATVSETNYTDSLSAETLDIIGYDWKSYNFTTGWSVSSDQVFFVKTNDSRLWKLQMIDFGGSANGTTTLQKTDLGLISNTNLLENKADASLRTFPNPSNGNFSIILDLPQQNLELNLEVFNQMGQQLYQQNLDVNAGLHELQLSNLNLSSGQYILRITGKDILLVNKISIQN